MTLTELFEKGAVTWNQTQNIERFAKFMLLGYQGDPQYNRALSISDSFGISCQDFMVSIKAWHLFELSEKYGINYHKVMSEYGKYYDYEVSSYLFGIPEYFKTVGDFEWSYGNKNPSASEIGVAGFSKLLVNLLRRPVTTEKLITVRGNYIESFWDMLYSTLQFQLDTFDRFDFATAFNQSIPNVISAKPGSNLFTSVTGLRRITLFSEKQNTCLFLKLMMDRNVEEFKTNVKEAFQVQ